MSWGSGGTSRAGPVSSYGLMCSTSITHSTGVDAWTGPEFDFLITDMPCTMEEWKLILVRFLRAIFQSARLGEVLCSYLWTTVTSPSHWSKWLQPPICTMVPTVSRSSWSLAEDMRIPWSFMLLRADEATGQQRLYNFRNHPWMLSFKERAPIAITNWKPLHSYINHIWPFSN